MCVVTKAQVARSVLTYLSTHRDAQDTLEGIVEWWLVEQRIVEQTATVRETLDELVSAGLLAAREDSAARIIYRLDPRQLERILAYLESASG
jgi:Fe2+ or Zn2+ uptake regulation protein